MPAGTHFSSIDAVDSLYKGGVEVSSSAAELNSVKDLPVDFTIAAAAGASTVCNVTITPKDANGDAIAHVMPLLIWLSDSATGEGLTGTAASGTVQAKAASGTVINALTAKKALLVQTLATGVFTLEITDSAKTLFKVCAQPLGGATPTVYSIPAASAYGA